MRSLLVIAATFGLVATSVQAHTCPWTKADGALVEHSVKTLFDSLKIDNRRAFDAIVTPDFMAFELGRRWNGEELFSTIVEAHKAGRTINWSIGPMVVRGDCNLAWAAWDNVGSSGIAPALMPRHWMESAALRRTPTGWRIEFLHSTSLAVPAAQ